MHVIKIIHNFNPPTPVPPTHALPQETLVPGVMIYNFGRLFRVNHYYIHVLDFSDPCPRTRAEKKRRNIAFSLYDYYSHTKYKNPAPGIVNL